jgi:glycosyltransferase involved in cell wall biosynthesis
MIRILVNGLAASAGGGLTYLRNLIPQFVRRQDLTATLLVNSSVARLLQSAENVRIAERSESGAAAKRFLSEQRILPPLIRECGAQVLISAGNVALRKSPVPQILLSRNSLYTSGDFYRDLRSRGEYRLLLDTFVKGRLGKKSVGWSDCAVAPSEAFADELRSWTGRSNIRCIPHGFDPEEFSRDTASLPDNIRTALGEKGDTLRLLFVSHYNYYRNFETLFRALPRLKTRLKTRRFKLYLTCKLNTKDNPGAYRTEAAASLLADLKLGDDVVQLGAVPYPLLHHVYRACDVYVTPAYAESFAHPLVEAMSCGLPVIASDLPVHREVCGDAALSFSRFHTEELAERVLQVAESPELSSRLANCGAVRVSEFSWEAHVDRLIRLANDLLKTGRKDC